MSARVLVTGASSGIGRVLALVFARHGDSLILTGRDAGRLEETAAAVRKFGVEADTIVLDLAAMGAPEQLHRQVKDMGLEVGTLVNNAGFGNYGHFPESDRQADFELLQLNVVALTMLTKLFLPGMLAAKRGAVLNVGSLAGFMDGPFMNTYFASKNYVNSFSVALAEELRGTGVKVSCLCPGPTATKFGERAHYGHVLSRFNVMDAKAVAERAYSGLMKGEVLVIPGWRNRLLSMVYRFAPLPRRTLARMVRKVSGY